jgi:hypothetical protein
LTLTCSPIWNQRLRTKFSSIQGSSSPILDAKHVRTKSSCSGNTAQSMRARRVCSTHQRVVFPSFPC